MLDWLIRLIIPPEFVIELRDGSATGRKGAIPGPFLSDCSDIARHFQLQGGRIYGTRGRGGLVLEFSPDLPPESHQRFRNLFGTYRHRFRK
jgi:hypothetical protein